MLYFCHRRGWQLLPQEWNDTDRRASLRQLNVPILLPTSRGILTLFDGAGQPIERFEHP
jgi:hypothetical protein